MMKALSPLTLAAMALALPLPALAQEHDHSGMDMDMPGMDDEAMPADRAGEDFQSGSGTSRLPGNEEAMPGLHFMAGD